jgi:hypothetical protein
MLPRDRCHGDGGNMRGVLIEQGNPVQRLTLTRK